VEDGDAPTTGLDRPNLSDGVVVLRPFRDDDADQIRRACQDPDIGRYIPIPRPYGQRDAVAYIARTRRQWDDGTTAAFAIADATDPTTVLGAINLAIAGSVGNAAYWIASPVRGIGLAHRALALLTEWALGTLDLGAVILEIHPTNAASQRVALAAGFHRAGTLDLNDATGERDHLIYSRLAASTEGEGQSADA
jgi:RimJ/RimL family protein N-acetyltransferase